MMDVSRAQVTSEDSNPDYFWCRICDRLALDPVIHSGGNGLIYCQRAFCLTCIDSFNPEVINRFGSRGGTISVCPTEGCLQNFVRPYFRAMSVIEVYHYKALAIKCLNCSDSFNVDQYAVHRLRCPGAPPAV